MKKTLIALAALAAVGAASAQVSLTGLAGLSYEKNASGTKANTGFGIPDLFLKATAVEDIGGGTKVTAAVQWDVGSARNAVSSRDDYSLSTVGGFGNLTLRSIEAGNYAEMALSGVASLPNGVDSTNAAYKSILAHANVKGMKYTTPVLGGGFTAALSYSQYEQNANGSTAALKDPSLNGYQTSTSLELKYAAGPLMAVYGRSQYNTSVNAGLVDSAKDDLAVTYDLGVAKFGLGWVQTSASNPAVNNVTPTVVAGVSVPFGKVTVGLDYATKQAALSSNDTITYTAVGVQYDLSKTTNVKFSAGGFSGITALSGTGAPTTDTQYRLALWKAF